MSFLATTRTRFKCSSLAHAFCLCLNLYLNLRRCPWGLPCLGVCASPLRHTFAKCPRLPRVLGVSSLYQQSFLLMCLASKALPLGTWEHSADVRWLWSLLMIECGEIFFDLRLTVLPCHRCSQPQVVLKLLLTMS